MVDGQGSNAPMTTRDSSPADVLYCHYPFLSFDKACDIQANDLNFLELQGCLRIPTRDLLCEFLQQYFLHVHPILPLVNERHFWDLYPDATRDLGTKPIPLLVLQAVLFASCTFVSPITVRKLGFSSTRSMRASYYRRAKLLYDFGSESSPLAIAQASLLLTFTSLSASGKPNMSWLSIAIENAKLAQAHLYASLPASSIPPEDRNLLKRVWWCCILRDRSTGLLMRRPILITKYHFDFASDPLCVTDLEDEFERSRVYAPETKRRLAEILAHWTKLTITLTDTLMLVFPLDDRQEVTSGMGSSILSQVQRCKSELDQWYNDVASCFSFAFSRTESHPSAQADSDVDKDHPSVVLYSRLMLMYYFTARVVLSHYELLQREMLQSAFQTLPIIRGSRQELKDTAARIALCHHELVSRGLDRWLPVSAIGCTAFPLILHTLDTKLLPQSDNGQTGNHFDALVQVMQTYQAQYDGVDWIREIVNNITNLSQVDELGSAVEDSATNFTDILAYQPDLYLRLALELDLSLQKGRLVDDEDFPVRLRGLSGANIIPLRSLVAKYHSATTNLHDTIMPCPGRLESSSSFVFDEDYLLQEQFSPPGSHENVLEALEAEIYLQLAGGAADNDISSSDATILEM